MCGHFDVVKMLVAAGGTHFPGAWQRYAQGQTFAHEGLRKRWLSQIYGLMDDQWRPVGRLPAPRANGISLEVDDGLVLIGGDSDEARPCLDTLWLRHSQMAQ
jgi:N-acetylneuraminate epimerase